MERADATEDRRLKDQRPLFRHERPELLINPGPLWHCIPLAECRHP
jgi:hypothetical protein